MYDFKKSKETIMSILNSPTKIVKKEKIPASDGEFTYSNGIKTWVGALFVDIVDSSKLFADANEDTARIMRSFCSEIIAILKDDPNYREIGIRGDCVYCIYTAQYQGDLVEIFRHAYRINSFMEMLNELLYTDAEKTLLLNDLKVHTTVLPVAIRNDELKTCVGFMDSINKARSLRKSGTSQDAKVEKKIMAIYAKRNGDPDFSELVYKKTDNT